MSLRETFHIEVLGPEDTTKSPAPAAILQRVSVRVESLDLAKDRALHLFSRARVPQRSDVSAVAVRIIDGAGTELFRWSRFDEPGG